MVGNGREKSISLRTHLWLYFCSFTVAIMIILWVLQIFFLSTFFRSMKVKELRKIGVMISKQYKMDYEDFDEYWLKHSYNSGIFAHIISEDGEIVRNSTVLPESKDGRNDFGKPFGEPKRFVDNDYFNKFVSKLSKSGNNEVSFIEKNDRFDASFAVYGSYIGKNDGKNMYLYLRSPLERTDTTRKVLQSQLIIVSGISVFLALILAYFISKRFSKPIEKATESAHELAKGNFDADFKYGSYSEINELADAMNFAARELSKTEALRRDLISNVSHDLRTPLTIIKSYAEMIRDISGNYEEKRNKHTGVIIDETNRLSMLVNDMLDLSRIQSGTIKMNFDAFDMNLSAKFIADSLDFYRENENYKFIINTDAAHQAFGDRQKIEQVMYNLVGNAINYTGEDKTVYISVCDTKTGVKFSVKDTGKGIPDNELDRVWDKYYKSSETHTRQTVGTGIGLSIVKNILDAHNAKFGVESNEKNGSIFWFELKQAN